MMKSRRRHGDGSIRQRGKDTWEIKVHSVDPKTGKQIRRFYSFKGSKVAAREKLNDIAKAAAGELRDDLALFGSVLDA